MFILLHTKEERVSLLVNLDYVENCFQETDYTEVELINDGGSFHVIESPEEIGRLIAKQL